MKTRKLRRAIALLMVAVLMMSLTSGLTLRDDAVVTAEPAEETAAEPAVSPTEATEAPSAPTEADAEPDAAELTAEPTDAPTEPTEAPSEPESTEPTAEPENTEPTAEPEADEQPTEDMEQTEPTAENNDLTENEEIAENEDAAEEGIVLMTAPAGGGVAAVAASTYPYDVYQGGTKLKSMFSVELPGINSAGGTSSVTLKIQNNTKDKPVSGSVSLQGSPKYFTLAFDSQTGPYLNNVSIPAGESKELTVTANSDLPVGTTSQTLAFRLNGNVLMGLVKVTVGSQTFTVTPPTTSPKPYGKTLSEDEIAAIVRGTTISPKKTADEIGLTLNSQGFDANANVGSYPYTASSSKGFMVEVAEKSPQFTVGRAKPVGSPTASDVKAGHTLADSKLSGQFTNPNNNQNVPGVLAWEGNTSQVVTGDQTYKWKFTPSNQNNYEAVSGEVTVHVTGKDPTEVFALEGELDTVTYDGKPHGMKFGTNRPSSEGAGIQVMYRPAGTEQTWNSEAPKNAGSYDIMVTVEESKNYARCEEVMEGKLTINQRVAAFTSSVSGKIYDGSTHLDVKAGEVRVLNQVSSDDVTVVATGEFDSPDAGNRNLKITVTRLEGRDAANYTLPANPSFYTVARIERRRINLQSQDIKKEYGDSLKLTADLFVGVSQLAPGDTMLDLPISFSVEDGLDPHDIPGGPYAITATIQQGNYSFGATSAGLTSTVSAGTLTVTKAKPVTPGVSTAMGKADGKLSDVSLTGEFVNPHTGEKVPGTLAWKDSGTILSSNENEVKNYPWIFTIDQSVQNLYAFNKDADYSFEGEAAVHLKSRLPIPLSVVSSSVTYNGQWQGLEDIRYGDEASGLKAEGLTLSVTYRPRGSAQEFSSDMPVNAGAYDVKVSVSVKTENQQQSPYNQYGPNEIIAELTITQADPQIDKIPKELTVAQGTTVAQLAGKLGWPCGVGNEELQGTYSWAENVAVEKDGQVYHWTFDPSDNNYTTAAGSVTVRLKPDKREVKAEIYNLPGDDGDYAVVMVDETVKPTFGRDWITFYNGDVPVGQMLVTPATATGKHTVSLEAGALDKDGGKLQVRFANSVMHQGSTVNYAPEPALTLNQEELIRAFQGETVDIAPQLIGQYTITGVTFRAEGTSIRVEQTGGDTSLSARVTGLVDFGHDHVIVEADIQHPDPAKTSETIRLTLRIHVQVYPAVGDLVVSKTVTGSEGDKNKPFTFTVTLTPPETGNTVTEADVDSADVTYGGVTFTNGTGTFTLKDGEKVTLAGIPAGTGYSVEESDNEGYEVTATGAEGKILLGETVTAAFTNQKGDIGGGPGTGTEDVGDLVVTKTVTGSAGDKSKPFTFTVTLTPPETEKPAAEAENDNADATVTYGAVTFTKGTGTFTLKHGESVTMTGIPAGTHYLVEESDNEGYQVNATGAEGEITPDTVLTAAFTNQKDDAGGGPETDPDKEPDKGTNEGTDKTVPATGDDNMPALWAGLVVLGLACLAATVTFSRRTGKKRSR